MDFPAVYFAILILLLKKLNVSILIKGAVLYTKSTKYGTICEYNVCVEDIMIVLATVRQ